MSISLRMPRRFLRGSYSQLALTVIALACGVALVCGMDLVTRAVARAFAEVVDTMAGRAALQVTASGASFPESVAEPVARIPEVELAVPVVSGTAFTTDGSGELLTVHGVDVTNESTVRAYEARDAGGLELEDPLIFLNQPDSVVVTRAWAARHHLVIGDRLPLLTPMGRRDFTVRGLLEPQGIARAHGGNLIVMDLLAAEAAFLRPGMINRIDVVVRRDASIADVAAQIAHVVPEGLRVEAPAQRKADLQRVMSSLAVMLKAVSLVGLCAAFLIIFNRLSTVFERRAWQLGVLRAVGLRSGAVWRELLKESLVLGGAGVLLGIPLGVAVGRVLLPAVATTAALNFKLIASEANLSVGAGSLILAAILGFAAALLAAAGPAWRVAKRSPADTIRGRGVDRPAGRVAWKVRAATALGIVATVTAQYATRLPSFGMAATGLIAVGGILAARPLLSALAPTLLAALRAALGPSVRFAHGTFATHSSRAAFTAALIGVGIGSIIWLRVLAYSFEASLVHALSGALQGDWVVTSSQHVQGYLEAPVDERLVLDVRKVDGVDAAVGERLVDWQYAGGPIAIDAFDSSYFTTGAFGRWPLVGDAVADVWDAVSAGRHVLASSSLAVNLDVRVGDTVKVETPHGPLPLIIGGITANFSSPRGTIVMSRELYRTHWDDAQVNRVFVRAARDADVSLVRTSIAQQLGVAYGLRIVSSRDLLDYFAAQVQRAFAPVDVLAVFLLVVILLGLADTLAASTVERTRELGTIRALGVRRRGVGRAVVAEGLAIGGLGIVLAVAVGTSLGMLWVRQTFPELLGWALETYVPYVQLAFVCSGTMVVCWIAAALPARSAAALQPAEALRCE